MNKTARRTGISAISAAATIAVVASYTGFAGQASAASTTGDPAAASSWLISQQAADGSMPSPYGAGFTDWGLSINVLWAMKAGGASSAAVNKTWGAISSNLKDYAGPGDYGISAGASAKALFAADVVNADPTKLVQKDKSVINILTQTSDLVLTSGAQKGRLKDPVANGADYTNAITQALGVLGLAGAGQRGQAVSKPLVQSTVDFLATQQCSDGYFRLSFNDNLSCDAAAKTKAGAPADLDSTSYALQALMLAKQDGYMVPANAITAGVGYLSKVQRANGSFGTNTNSTGLATAALAGGGAASAAMRGTGYIAGLQAVGSKISGTKLASSNGAIAFDQSGYDAGLKDGITSTAADQWRRATADAQFGLVRKPLGSLLKDSAPTTSPTGPSSSTSTATSTSTGTTTSTSTATGTSTSTSTATSTSTSTSTSTGTSTAPGAPSTSPTGSPTDPTEPPTPTATTTTLPVTG
ncbi:MAG: hypothetical protein ABI384_06215 [Allobranchiibius sp.]